MKKDSKLNFLKSQNALHSTPSKVVDQLFGQNPFFDPRDLVQVKYEMLRCVRVDGMQASKAAKLFGLSRPTYYKANASFETKGLLGLLPEKKGPQRAHKLSTEVMDFIKSKQKQDSTLKAAGLVPLIQQAFGIRVHRRSIERALKRVEKKTS